jgi:hypothetical protein
VRGHNDAQGGKTVMGNKLICAVMSGLLVGCFMTETVTAQPDQVKSASSVTADAPRTFFVYYFHGDFRCSNCKKIEQYSREAIEKYFADQLKTGELVFKIINTDRPENKHFITEYQLYTRSLVIAEFKGDTQLKWKNLTGVWNHLNDPDAFYDYVKTEIQTYLEST